MPVDDALVAKLEEDPMLARLLTWARGHDEVRAAVLNGSRANPNAPVDAWQDYDFNIAERTPGYFNTHSDYLDAFGPYVIMQHTHGFQTPTGWLDVTREEYDNYVASGTLPGIHHYNIMAIFADGKRVDFSVVPADSAAATYTDSMTIPLLDKDGIIPPLPPTSDSGYHVKRPTPTAFRNLCNEMWWVSTYVAKALLRGELVRAQKVLDVVRDQTLQLLEWRIGSHNNWEVNPGHFGKWLQRFLTVDEWEALCATFPHAEPDDQWRALFVALELGSKTARDLVAALGEEYFYDLGEEERTLAYLRNLKALQS